MSEEVLAQFTVPSHSLLDQGTMASMGLKSPERLLARLRGKQKIPEVFLGTC
jgi:hypothetical protein